MDLALADSLWSRIGRGTAPRHRKRHGYRGRHQGATAHQASFRDAVLSAYGSRCAISHLPAPRLPDVAHIIVVAEEQLGQPIVSNGLPLTSCLRSQRLCRRCDIPRLPGRRLTDCAIAENGTGRYRPTGRSVSTGSGSQDAALGSRVPLGIKSVPASGGAGPEGCSSDADGFQRCFTKPSFVKAFARFVRSPLNGTGGEPS